MIFPFEIKFRLKIKSLIENNRQFIVKTFVVDEFKKLKVDEFSEGENRTNFKNSFFNGQGRNHIFAAVDGGYIQYLRNEIILNFSTKRICLFSLVASLFFMLISKSITVGFVCFLWLYGMNVVVFLVRGKFLVRRLKSEIEKLE